MNACECIIYFANSQSIHRRKETHEREREREILKQIIILLFFLSFDFKTETVRIKFLLCMFICLNINASRAYSTVILIYEKVQKKIQLNIF